MFTKENLSRERNLFAKNSQVAEGSAPRGIVLASPIPSNTNFSNRSFALLPLGRGPPQVSYRAKSRFLKIDLIALRQLRRSLRTSFEFSRNYDPILIVGCGLRYDCKVTCAPSGSLFSDYGVNGSEKYLGNRWPDSERFRRSRLLRGRCGQTATPPSLQPRPKPSLILLPGPSISSDWPILVGRSLDLVDHE